MSLTTWFCCIILLVLLLSVSYTSPHYLVVSSSRCSLTTQKHEAKKPDMQQNHTVTAVYPSNQYPASVDMDKCIAQRLLSHLELHFLTVSVDLMRTTCMCPVQFCTQSATATSSLCLAILSFTWINRTSKFMLS